MATTITINGTTHIIHGNHTSVTVKNGSVVINGQSVESGLSGVVEIKWDGPAVSVTSDASVSCGDVQGNVRASGSVSSGNVNGSIQAGGSVQCETVGGNIAAGGSVSCRR